MTKVLFSAFNPRPPGGGVGGGKGKGGENVPSLEASKGFISKTSIPCILPRISNRSNPVACSRSVGMVPTFAPGPKRSAGVFTSVIVPSHINIYSSLPLPRPPPPESPHSRGARTYPRMESFSHWVGPVAGRDRRRCPSCRCRVFWLLHLKRGRVCVSYWHGGFGGEWGRETDDGLGRL